MTKRRELPRKKKKSQCQRRKMTPSGMFFGGEKLGKYRMSHQKKTKRGEGGRTDRLFCRSKERGFVKGMSERKKRFFFSFSFLFSLEQIVHRKRSLGLEERAYKCRKLFSFLFSAWEIAKKK